MGQNGERQVAMRSQPPIASKNVSRPATLQLARVPVEFEIDSQFGALPAEVAGGLLYSPTPSTVRGLVLPIHLA